MQSLVAKPHFTVAIEQSDTTNGERRRVTHAMKLTNEVLKNAVLSNKEEAAKQCCLFKMIDGTRMKLEL